MISDTHQLKESITTFVMNNFTRARSESFSASTNLLESGIIDSLGLLTIIAYLEEAFDIRVCDEEVVTENFGSVDAMVAYLSRKVPQGRQTERSGSTAIDSAPGIA